MLDETWIKATGNQDIVAAKEPRSNVCLDDLVIADSELDSYDLEALNKQERDRAEIVQMVTM